MVRRTVLLVFARTVATLLVWAVLMIAVGFPLQRWYFDGLKDAHARGNIEPSELVFAVPVFMLVGSYYIGRTILGRLVRRRDVRD